MPLNFTNENFLHSSILRTGWQMVFIRNKMQVLLSLPVHFFNKKYYCIQWIIIYPMTFFLFKDGRIDKVENIT